MIPSMEYEHLFIFGGVCVATWFLVIYVWPRMMLSVYKRGLLVKGFGDGPVPINTLYTQPQALFSDPLRTPLSPGSSNLMTRGVNHDTLLTVGWLDSGKDLKCCMCRISPGAITAGSSPIRRKTPILPTSANAPRALMPASSSSAAPTGREPCSGE